MAIPAASILIVLVGYIFCFTGEWLYNFGEAGSLQAAGKLISCSLRYSPPRNYNLFVPILYRNLKRPFIYSRTSMTRTQVSGFELSCRSIMHYYSDDRV